MIDEETLRGEVRTAIIRGAGKVGVRDDLLAAMVEEVITTVVRHDQTTVVSSTGYPKQTGGITWATAATRAHPNCMIEGGGQRDRTSA